MSATKKMWSGRLEAIRATIAPRLTRIVSLGPEILVVLGIVTIMGYPLVSGPPDRVVSRYRLAVELRMDSCVSDSIKKELTEGKKALTYGHLRVIKMRCDETENGSAWWNPFSGDSDFDVQRKLATQTHK